MISLYKAETISVGRNIMQSPTSGIDSISSEPVMLAQASKAEQLLWDIAQVISSGTGTILIQGLVKHLTKALGVSYALVGVSDNNDTSLIKTIALSRHGSIINNFSYSLEGTPCEKVFEGTSLLIESGVKGAFPNDHILRELNIDSYAAAPLFDSYGNSLGIIAILDQKPLDHTQRILSILKICASRVASELERNKNESQLKYSENRFRSYFNAPLIGIAISSSNKQWLEINDKLCEMLGYSREELLKMTWSEITHHDDLEKNLDLFEELLAGKIKNMNFKKRFIKKNGEIMYAAMSALTVRKEDHSVDYIIALIQDITNQVHAEKEQQKLEVQLLHAQKLESLGILAGGIAHDFNNLLVGILGNASLLIDELQPQSPVLSKVTKIHLAATRASELTNQMLSYSGKGKFDMKSINLSKLVKEIESLLGSAISKKANVFYNCPQTAPFIEGDPTQIRQILMNLVINASDAVGDKSGDITISIESIGEAQAPFIQDMLGESLVEQEYICLEVRDNGCGMDEKTLRKIFDPFFTTKFSGRGLGLAAVLGIVRSHNGRIAVTSAEEAGTSFRVYFPITQNKLAHKKLLKSDIPLLNEHRSTILVVDDEETVREVAGEMLKSMGYKVIGAVDGEEALETYERNHTEICAILLDLTMPRMDGSEVIKELRKIDKKVSIIISSGYSEADVSSLLAKDKNTTFLQKPYDRQALQITISKQEPKTNAL